MTRGSDGAAADPLEPVHAAVAAIRPLLAGKGAAVQGAVLAELTALWLCGHPRAARAALLDYHIEAIKALAEITATLEAAERRAKASSQPKAKRRETKTESRGDDDDA